MDSPFRLKSVVGRVAVQFFHAMQIVSDHAAYEPTEYAGWAVASRSPPTERLIAPAAGEMVQAPRPVSEHALRLRCVQIVVFRRGMGRYKREMRDALLGIAAFWLVPIIIVAALVIWGLMKR